MGRLSGGSWISRFHQLVVKTGFVGHFGRLSNQLPDPFEDHGMFRMVLPDLFALLAQLLSHSGHLRVEVRVLRLDLVEFFLGHVKLFPIRCLRQFSENVSGSTVVQGVVGSPGDMVQPVVLRLKIRQVIKHPLKGVFRKLPRGQIHVPLGGLKLWPAGSGSVRRTMTMTRRGRGWRIGHPRDWGRTSGWRGMSFRNFVVAFCVGVGGHRLELVVDLLDRNHDHIIFLPGGAPVVLVKV